MENFNIYVKRDNSAFINTQFTQELNQRTLDRLNNGELFIDQVELQDLVTIKGETTEAKLDLFIMEYQRNGQDNYLFGFIENSNYKPVALYTGNSGKVQYLPVFDTGYYPEHGMMLNQIPDQHEYDVELSRGSKLSNVWSSSPSNSFLGRDVFLTLERSVPYYQEYLETNTILSIFGRNLHRLMMEGVYPDVNKAISGAMNNSVQFFDLGTGGRGTGHPHHIALLMERSKDLYSKDTPLFSNVLNCGISDPEMLRSLYGALQPHYNKYIMGLKDTKWKVKEHLQLS